MNCAVIITFPGLWSRQSSQENNFIDWHVRKKPFFLSSTHLSSNCPLKKMISQQFGKLSLRRLPSANQIVASLAKMLASLGHLSLNTKSPEMLLLAFRHYGNVLNHLRQMSSKACFQYCHKRFGDTESTCTDSGRKWERERDVTFTIII